MENKKTAMGWLLIVAIALMIGAVVLNLYVILGAETLEAYTLPMNILNCLTCLAGLVYWIRGYQKDAAKWFQLFCILYALTLMTGVLVMAVERANNVYSLHPMMLELISFGILCILIVAKDLGRVKSLALVGINVLCSLAQVVVALFFHPDAVLGILRGLLLALVVWIMVYAKYVNKAERGSK